MVNRQGDEIHFTPGEQAEFSLPPTVSLESAYETAIAFCGIAQQVEAHGWAKQEGRSRGALTNGKMLQVRAARLDNKGKEILELLGPEIAESAAVMLFTDDDSK